MITIYIIGKVFYLYLLHLRKNNIDSLLLYFIIIDMPAKTYHITCKDNHQMPIYAWLPNQEPAAILFIVHGMAEYAERYSTIAGSFVKNNLAVFAIDNRGHGKAVTDINELGIVEDNWFNNQVEDLLLAIDNAKATYPNKKIFLLGHSMGSFLCQRFH